MNRCASIRVLRSLAFAATFTMAHGCAAAPAEATEPCADAATESELLDCRRKEKVVAEETMQLVLDELLESYRKDEPALRGLLVTAQAEWLEYRDAECRVRTYYSASGTAHELYWLSCITALDRARTADLERLKANP